jgi:hypothetical protein
VTKIKSLFQSLSKYVTTHPSVQRALHTSWQAAAGTFVAAMSGTHGDVRTAIVVSVAAGLAAVRTLIFQVPAPAAPEGAILVTAPAVPVDVVSTPSTPASANVDPAP